MIATHTSTIRSSGKPSESYRTVRRSLLFPLPSPIFENSRLAFLSPRGRGARSFAFRRRQAAPFGASYLPLHLTRSPRIFELRQEWENRHGEALFHLRDVSDCSPVWGAIGRQRFSFLPRQRHRRSLATPSKRRAHPSSDSSSPSEVTGRASDVEVSSPTCSPLTLQAIRSFRYSTDSR